MSIQNFRDKYQRVDLDIIRKGAYFFYKKFIKAKQKNEDDKRREYILNIILIVSIFISSAFAMSALISDLKLAGTMEVRDGVPTRVVAGVALVFFGLYLLSRKGFHKGAIFIVLALYFIPITYTGYFWGMDAPQALLGYALIIVMSGVLLNVRASILVALLITVVIFIVANFQVSGEINISNNWKDTPMQIKAIVQLLITIGVISVVTWLSNFEINKSLKRARESEKALKKERDLLEIRVGERTRELKTIQVDRVKQLHRFAEFGKISSGLFHDITNHLTALFLNIEDLEERGNPKEMKGVKENMEQILLTRQSLEDFMLAIKKQLQEQGVNEVFSLVEEIEQVIKVFRYRACKESIEIDFKNRKSININGNSIRFNQIVTNLLANSFDAYKKEPKGRGSKRKIEIVLDKKNEEICLSVQDWGCGISSDIKGKIFEPFFSTKGIEHGIGIGLFSVKEIIEKEFAGQISIGNTRAKGTRFDVVLRDKDSPKKKM